MLEILETYIYYLRTVENIEKITETNYVCNLELFFKFVRHRDYNKVTQEDILKYIEYLKQKNLAPRTIRKKLTILKGFYAWLVFQEKILVSPFQKIRIRNHFQPSVVKKVFSEKDIKKLLTPEEEIINMGFKKLRDEVIIRILLATGIRRKELLNIRISEIDLEAKTIHLKNTKTKRERIVYFDDTTRWWLEKYLKRRFTYEARHDYLFIDGYRKQVKEGILRRLIDKRLKDAGLKSKGTATHTFRHTVATRLLENGVPVKVVQEILGHSDIKTTLGIYSHPSQEYIEREYKKGNIFKDQEIKRDEKFDEDLL